MAPGVRDRMVESAVVLLAKHGYQATSFTTVLEAAKAPRGSVYHHFPDGKDQLIAAAVALAGGRAISLMDGLAGRGAVDVVEGFLAMWRAVLVRSNLTAGCAVLAVTVSADSDDLLNRARDIFRQWVSRLADVLASGGVPAGQAHSFATLLVASTEGAVVLSRAERDLEPFETVGRELLSRAADFVS